jgi:uroporphyrinogen-III synthase
MSKKLLDKKNPATKSPLAGIRILVGRARHQAGALSAALRAQGAEVIEIPFIEIRKPKSFAPLDAALKNLHNYDWLILTSVNGVEAMWQRMEKLKLTSLPQEPAKSNQENRELFHAKRNREGHEFTRAATAANSIAASAAAGRLRVAAIGPATKKAIEQRGMKVDVVPKEYIAESVVRSLRRRVKGKRILLVRAKVARDVIPRELRKAGALVDVVEAYETVVPQTSRRRLQALLKNPKKLPHVISFTSSSTVRNFVELLGSREAAEKMQAVSGRGRPLHTTRTSMASIGPVTSATLRKFGLPVDVHAKQFSIPGLVDAIVRWATSRATT